MRGIADDLAPGARRIELFGEALVGQLRQLFEVGRGDPDSPGASYDFASSFLHKTFHSIREARASFLRLEKLKQESRRRIRGRPGGDGARKTRMQSCEPSADLAIEALAVKSCLTQASRMLVRPSPFEIHRSLLARDGAALRFALHLSPPRAAPSA